MNNMLIRPQSSRTRNKIWYSPGFHPCSVAKSFRVLAILLKAVRVLKVVLSSHGKTPSGGSRKLLQKGVRLKLGTNCSMVYISCH